MKRKVLRVRRRTKETTDGKQAAHSRGNLEEQ